MLARLIKHGPPICQAYPVDRVVCPQLHSGDDGEAYGPSYEGSGRDIVSQSRSRLLGYQRHRRFSEQWRHGFLRLHFLVRRRAWSSRTGISHRFGEYKGFPASAFSPSGPPTRHFCRLCGREWKHVAHTHCPVLLIVARFFVFT